MSDLLRDLIASLPPQAAATGGIWVAALLTLAVLSYVVGRNVFFRFAQHLFVGVAAGYAAALTWTNVLAPRLARLWADPATYWYYGLFTLLGVLLLARGVRAISAAGNLPLGVLLGAGAGLALAGALTGSLVAQVRASLVSVSPAAYGGGLAGWAYALDALLLVLGTLAVLAAYQFRTRGARGLGALWQALLRPLSGVGRLFILVVFGALYAGAILSFFAILMGRLDFIISDWLGLFGEMGF